MIGLRRGLIGAGRRTTITTRMVTDRAEPCRQLLVSVRSSPRPQPVTRGCGQLRSEASMWV